MGDKKTVHVELRKGVAKRLRRLGEPGDSYSDIIDTLMKKVDAPVKRVSRYKQARGDGVVE